MKPWMKIALGCLAVSIMGVFVLVGGVVGFGYWAKSKVLEVTGGGPVVEEARKTANAVPFTPPARNIIGEPRLVRFLEVRASVFSVYERYRGEIEARVARVKSGESLDLSDLSTGLTLMGELQKAEALALAKHGMSENEYAFINQEVNKSMWADMGAGDAGLKAINEAAQAARTATDAMKGPGVKALPAEAREALANAESEISAGAKDVAQTLENMKTTSENVALFKKYETELKKYSMPGLSILFSEGRDASAKRGARD